MSITTLEAAFALKGLDRRELPIPTPGSRRPAS